jgi:hypothetical protein
VLSGEPLGGTRVRGSGVCTAVNGFVPLTGRRTHLVLHYIYIVFTIPGRMPHRPHSLEPKVLLILVNEAIGNKFAPISPR